MFGVILIRIKVVDLMRGIFGDLMRRIFNVIINDIGICVFFVQITNLSLRFHLPFCPFILLMQYKSDIDEAYL